MTARIFLTLKINEGLNNFVIKTLALPKEYSPILAKAAKHNTYVETISDKADSLHLKVKENYLDILPLEYFNYVKHILRQKRVGSIDLIGDITEENYYGKIQGLHVFPWTGEDGIEGKFCYLVIGITYQKGPKAKT